MKTNCNFSLSQQIKFNNYQNFSVPSSKNDNRAQSTHITSQTSFKGRKMKIFVVGLVAFAIGWSSLFEYNHARNFLNVGCLAGGAFTMIMTTLVALFGKRK